MYRECAETRGTPEIVVVAAVEVPVVEVALHPSMTKKIDHSPTVHSMIQAQGARAVASVEWRWRY